MKSKVSLVNFWNKNFLIALFALSIVIWIFAFQGYIFGDLALTSDATSYYDHTKYYIDQLMQGKYPLWDPFWWCGFSNEFFLRRIGAYNPFLFLIVFFRLMGLPHFLAYMFFLIVYHFIGMIGFYLLAKRLWKDEFIAFACYLVLSFSALGTRMFDSYFHLVYVPLIWFFYFLVSFSQKQERYSLLGLTFTVMSLISTYIPFYFVTIIAVFVLFFLVIYPRRSWGLSMDYGRFCLRNKLLIVFCLLAVVLAGIPGVMFYKTVEKAEVVFPHRNFDFPTSPSSPSSNQLEVDIENAAGWAIMEDLAYSVTHYDLRKFRLAFFYMPIFFYIMFFVGAITKLNKRLFFLSCVTLLIFLMGCTFKVGVFPFLREHIFYFKFLRNLHFFLWFFVIPAIVVFVGEQFKEFLAFQPTKRPQRIAVILFLLLVHGGFIAFLVTRGGALISSYVVVGLSLVFFLLCFFGKLVTRKKIMFLLLLGIVVSQPLEVYDYLQKNHKEKKVTFFYDNNTDIRVFRESKIPEIPRDLTEQILELDSGKYYLGKKVPLMYVGNKWAYQLVENVNGLVLAKAIWPVVTVYDRIEWIDDNQMDFQEILRAFFENRNVAFVSPGSVDKKFGLGQQDIRLTSDGTIAEHSLQIANDSDQIRILAFDVNSIAVRTNFNGWKFLVYNDSFDDNWFVFVDGSSADVLRANVAFKGVWVPPGEHKVFFRYGTPGQYAFNWFLLFFYSFVFLLCCHAWQKTVREKVG